MLQKLKNQFNSLINNIPAKHRRTAVIAIIALVVTGILYGVVAKTPEKKEPVKKKLQQKQVFVPHNLDQKYGITSVTAEMERVKKQNEKLQKKVEEMEDLVNKVKTSVPDPKVIRAEVEKNLREEIKRQMQQQKPPEADGPPKPGEAKPDAKRVRKSQADQQDWIKDFQKHAAGKSEKPGTAETGKPGAASGGVAGKSAQGQAAKPSEIREISAKEQAADKEQRGGVSSAKGKDKDTGTYLPAGSIFSGTLLTGVDVTTGEGSRRDPFPVLLRVKKEAILPNRYRTDVKECFLVAAGWGDLSSERAYLRAEKLSCIREDGKALESKVEMYAVGEDGKAGVRGRVVNKTGALLGRALMAGFLEGFSKLFGKSQVMTIQTGSLGRNAKAPYESYLSSDALQSAGLSGVGSAMDRLANYYIDMAENIYPIIEVDAGRAIDFVMLNGVSLKLHSTKVSDNVARTQ